MKIKRTKTERTSGRAYPSRQKEPILVIIVGWKGAYVQNGFA